MFKCVQSPELDNSMDEWRCETRHELYGGHTSTKLWKRLRFNFQQICT